MYRTVKTSFKASKSTMNELYAISRTCGVIWNDCIELARYYYRLGKKWINQTQLQEEIKGKYDLHSQTIQAVAHKFLEARSAALEARKKGLNNKYPWKHKKFFNPKWVDKSFELNGKVLTLSFGNVKGSNGKRKTPLKLTLSTIPKGDVKEIELIYDRGFKICLSYEDGQVEQVNQNTETSSIDFGEIHLISVASTNGDSLIITGREVRSIHRLRNKKLKELQQKMSHCKKYSRKWKKYNKAKQYILSKSNAQIENALHQTSKKFVDFCVENHTKDVVAGDVEGVQRNTSKRRSKKINQKLSNWSVGKLYTYLSYKLKAKGISISKVNEAYTSQTCPVCGNRKKVNSRNYVCKCGYKKHRDVHGACNILSKHLHGRMILIPTGIPKYLRPVTLTRA